MSINKNITYYTFKTHLHVIKLPNYTLYMSKNRDLSKIKLCVSDPLTVRLKLVICPGPLTLTHNRIIVFTCYNQ